MKALIILNDGKQIEIDNVCEINGLEYMTSDDIYEKNEEIHVWYDSWDKRKVFKKSIVEEMKIRELFSKQKYKNYFI